MYKNISYNIYYNIKKEKYFIVNNFNISPWKRLWAAQATYLSIPTDRWYKVFSKKKLRNVNFVYVHPFYKEKNPEIAVELFCAGSLSKGESYIGMFHMDKKLVSKWVFPVCLDLLPCQILEIKQNFKGSCLFSLKLSNRLCFAFQWRKCVVSVK